MPRQIRIENYGNSRSTLVSNGARRTRERIKVGVVGCGYWGPNLARNFRLLPDCNLKMICDLSEKRLAHVRSLCPEAKAEKDYTRMLNEGRLDAVVIATAVKLHFPMAKASLLAGKHTMIEKPMASSSAECEELIEIARRKGLVLMVGHTFLYSPAVAKIKEIVECGDIGDLRYICSRRLNLGLFQKDINVAWDLAPHDVSIILHVMGELPTSVNCRGSAHITPGVEDVTSMCLTFPKDRSAIIHSSWLDPRKVREMTIVGSKRMIVYDDVAPLEKIRIFDSRVERPPHYDTFAEFHYAYHYGDMYAPYLKQEEPLKIECQHFLDCIREGRLPISCGKNGLDLVRILEASSLSLSQHGSPITLESAARAVVPVLGDQNPGRATNGNSRNGDHTPPNDPLVKPLNGGAGA
ncbi:MAG: Gfo/Idh/MocA family oxidoreductase [Verrucomicrobia bacterium]|nr:Gfo/Idh/MocA family oxidoreductase [Verrucomicrobiota bacterium]